MLQHELLVVPGYQGSGPGHWQSWLEGQVPTARRVDGIDWEQPVLDPWVDAIVRYLRRPGWPRLIVAHSFGCLASAVAAQRVPEKVAGLFLVAPVDPQRLGPNGFLRSRSDEDNLANHMPRDPLRRPGTIVCSDNDPWVSPLVAARWAGRWGLRFTSIGDAGHINIASGFGPWSEALDLLTDIEASALAHAWLGWPANLRA
jgi:hypothetical protein